MEKNNDLTKHTVFVSIGANTQERRLNIEKAIERLNQTFEDFRVSQIYETACWRGEGLPYLNTVASFLTEMDATSLEKMFKEWEAEAGRKTDANSRNIVPLDIDVVVCNGGILKLRDFERNYFKIGFLELCNPQKIKIESYKYNLPDTDIALYPLPDRDKCKLLVYDKDRILSDTVFDKIGRFLPQNSFLVYNNTRVINARLRFKKESGATIEIFCLEPVSPADYQLNFSSTGQVTWKCLVGNSKRWKNDVLSKTIHSKDKTIDFRAERIDKSNGDSLVKFFWNDDSVTFSEIIEVCGEIPIPPYLNRGTEDSDINDYQTVYNKVEGSVAAPTAGLHFTEELLAQLEASVVNLRNVTLHVGAGTFQPVKTADIGHHEMHAELIDVSRDFIEELALSKEPLSAVGTTTVRTLESLYHIGCMIHQDIWNGTLPQWYPYSINHPELSVKDSLQSITRFLESKGENKLIASTQIIIAPGYRFRITDNLITNFHQPGSTLLLLIAAITGPRWREIYDYALAHNYRFLSYGDACLFLSMKNRIQNN